MFVYSNDQWVLSGAKILMPEEDPKYKDRMLAKIKLGNEKTIMNKSIIIKETKGKTVSPDNIPVFETFLSQ